MLWYVGMGWETHTQVSGSHTSTLDERERDWTGAAGRANGSRRLFFACAQGQVLKCAQTNRPVDNKFFLAVGLGQLKRSTKPKSQVVPSRTTDDLLSRAADHGKSGTKQPRSRSTPYTHRVHTCKLRDVWRLVLSMLSGAWPVLGGGGAFGHKALERPGSQTSGGMNIGRPLSGRKKPTLNSATCIWPPPWLLQCCLFACSPRG